jgi:hypothetical protein
MIRHIFGLLYNSFLVFFTVQFCGVFCSKKILKVWAKVVTVFVWIVLLSILSYTVDKVAIKLPIVALIGMLGILLFYETSIKKALLFELFATFISLVSDFTVYSLSRIWEPQQNVNDVFSNTISYYSGVASMVVQIILLLLIERIFRKVDAKQITVNLWSRYMLFPLFSLFILGVILFSIDSNLSESMGTAITLVAIALVVMNMYVFYFLKNDISNHIETERLSMVYSNADEIQKMYQRLSNERDRLGKENHEFKNMVSVWSRLLKNQEYSKLDKLMDIASKAEHGHTNVYITGNETVDIILNDKFFEAAEQGINFVADIKDLSNIHIKDEEIIVLLSNILNNAIESCELVEKAVIFVKIAEMNGNFILSVKNSFSGEVNSEAGTTKPDKLHHGYGIPNMKSVVAKHNGSYRTEKKDNMYATYVVIPKEE